MSYDYALAKKFKELAGQSADPAFQIGTVEQVSPLVISLYDGEAMLQGRFLLLSETLKQKTLYPGDSVALIGQRVFLAIDKVV